MHIYSAETIQELQNAMDFHQQHVHKKQVKALVTMEGRFQHDPSMTRDRPATVVPQSLTCQVRSHPLYWKTQHFVRPISLKNAICSRPPSKTHVEHLQNEAILRDFLKHVIGRHDPTRHESAIYIVGTILKLQNTKKLQRQLIHQQHLQSHLQCGNHPWSEHDARDGPATVVPQSLPC